MKDKFERLFALSCLLLAVVFFVVMLFASGEIKLPEKKEAPEPAQEAEEERAYSAISENDLTGMEESAGRFVISYDEKIVKPGETDLNDSKKELTDKNIFVLWNGTVSDANAIRADVYVEFKVNDSEGTSGDGSGETTPDGKKGYITVEYNDDFFIPEFDSFDAAIRICNAYEVAGYDAEAVRTDNEELRSAVEPAVRIIFKDNNELLLFPAIRALAGEL